MNDLKSFLNKLGELHDSSVAKMTVDVTQGYFSIEIDDIYSNFYGLPEYKGPESGRITLWGISGLSITLSLEIKLWKIFEFSASEEENDGRGAVKIKSTPAGSITMNYERAEFPR